MWVTLLPTQGLHKVDRLIIRIKVKVAIVLDPFITLTYRSAVPHACPAEMPLNTGTRTKLTLMVSSYGSSRPPFLPLRRP